MSWAIWAILAVCAIVVEIMAPTFFAFFVGVGFAVAAIAAYAALSFGYQLVSALFGMFLGLYFFRKRKIGEVSASKIGQSDEFIGMEGIVVEVADNENDGKVRFSQPILGERVWNAETSDGALIAKNDRVALVSVQGMKAIVKKIN